jgi:hypothetical protein
MTSFQGRQWVVGYACHCIIGDSFIHNFQETILMLRTIRSMVKIVKQEHEINNIQPLFLDKPSSYVFIELFDFSLGNDLIPHFSSTISPNLNSQYGSLQP